MSARNDERWKSLCEEASRETDPDRLMKLIEEINDILGEKNGGDTAKDVPVLTPKGEHAA